MGTRGNSKKMKEQQGEPSQASHPGPKHANRSWSDCSPAFRTQAGDLMLCAKAIPKNTAKTGRLADKFASRDPPTKSSYAAAHLNVAERAKKKFMRCLREFKLNPTERSLYPVELKAMVNRGSTTFCVYYKHTEQYDDLAMSLARSYDRIKDSLQDALIDFIKEQNMVKECMKVSNLHPRLYINGLPPPGSIQALAVFMQNEKVVDVVEIHGNPNDIVLILTELGRNLYLGFLRAIIEQHKRRKSWNGMLSIEDLQVRDGSVFEISKEALVDATGETMAKDFTKLDELLKAFFQKERVRPVYFSDHEDDLARSSEKLGTSAFHPQTIAFQEYVLSHLALKWAMARGQLWLDLYRVHQQLGRGDQQSLRTHLTGVAVLSDWTTASENHPMLKDVLHAGLDPKGRGKGNSSSTSIEYFNHMHHLLLFMRHVIQHGPDNTKTGQNGEQKLKNLMEGDLIIAKYLPQAAMHLIRFFRSNRMVLADKFSDAWTSFSSSS